MNEENMRIKRLLNIQEACSFDPKQLLLEASLCIRQRNILRDESELQEAFVAENNALHFYWTFALLESINAIDNRMLSMMTHYAWGQACIRLLGIICKVVTWLGKCFAVNSYSLERRGILKGLCGSNCPYWGFINSHVMSCHAAFSICIS